MQKFFKPIILITVPMIILFTGLSQYVKYKNKPQYLYFEGPDNLEAVLYKIQKTGSNQTKLNLVQKINTHSKNLIPTGNYLIKNECSSYKFTLTKNKPVYITLNLLQIQYFDVGLNSTHAIGQGQNVEIRCSSKATGEKFKYTDKSDFYILPGKNMINVAGTNFIFESSNDNAKHFVVELAPLKLISNMENDNTEYFVQPVQIQSNHSQSENPLVSARVNHILWLNPGKYEVEINGTKSIVTIQARHASIIRLGTLRISQPKNFFLQEDSKFSIQPIFAYINKKILFSLDKDYAVFPGHYTINLNNSEIERSVEVFEGNLSKIQTFGAQINAPVCFEDAKQNCTFSQKVFIYNKNLPYVRAKIALGTPFLVFQDDYQYSMEGADGIRKNLQISHDSVKIEQIGRLKFNWKLQISPNNFETRKIYLESSSSGLNGKTEDLNGYKPREMLLPEGEYHLNYFIKHEKNALQKNTISVRIRNDASNEVLIPIFANSSQSNNIIFQEDEKKPQEPSTLTPIAP